MGTFMFALLGTIGLAVYVGTESVWWAIGSVFIFSVVVLVLWVLWERTRTNQDRIHETQKQEYVRELDHTFTDQMAYFRILGRDWGPFPIVPVNGGNMQAPCFVRCIGHHPLKGTRSYLAFRLTDYRIRPADDDIAW